MHYRAAAKSDANLAFTRHFGHEDFIETKRFIIGFRKSFLTAFKI
jgi:hypothetical protein